MTFDLDRTRAYLKAKRDFYGYDTAIGHRCSNLLEQVENLDFETNGLVRTNLKNQMEIQLRDLEKLCAAAQAGG